MAVILYYEDNTMLLESSPSFCRDIISLLILFCRPLHRCAEETGYGPSRILEITRKPLRMLVQNLA